MEVPDPPVAGDFNGNGVLDGADIDMLSAEVRAGTNLPKFDLDRNNLVNEEDRRVAVEDLAQTWFGDADFSQSVDFSDFALLAARFGESGGWQDGDFDGNGLVEFADFVLLANNFGNQKT